MSKSRCCGFIPRDYEREVREEEHDEPEDEYDDGLDPAFRSWEEAESQFFKR